MAISTGDICQEAMTALQAQVTAGQGEGLSLRELCFIFKVTNEPTDEDVRENLQDMFDWFKAQEWTTTGAASTSMEESQPALVKLDWVRQSITFTPFKVKSYIEW